MTRLQVDGAEFDKIVQSRSLRRKEDDLYELVLVGVILLKDSVVFAKPKFKDGSHFDLGDAIRLLRGYFGRSTQRRPIVDSLREAEFCGREVLREYDALLELRSWFQMHGLYRREQRGASKTGRAHWTRTIAQQSPLIMQGSVVYPNIIAERRYGVLNDVSALQAGLMARLSERYELPLSADIVGAEVATGCRVATWPLPVEDIPYAQRQVAAERREQFRSDNLRLLTMLNELLDSRSAYVGRQPQIFGTTAFYSVWEDGCRVLFDGVGSPQSYLAKATWVTPTPDLEYTQHEQVPDVIVQCGNLLLILDAKYYYPFPHSQPGAPDIIKQVYYAEALLPHKFDDVRSLFLFPKVGATTPEFLGIATIKDSVRPFPIVEAWGLDPSQVFSNYPSPNPSLREALVNALVKGSGTVSGFLTAQAS